MAFDDNGYSRGLVLPSGEPVSELKEPAQGPFFGFFDGMGAMNAIRFESIMAVVADSRSGKFTAILSNGQACLLSATDGVRLLKRMGWTEHAKPGKARQ